MPKVAFLRAILKRASILINMIGTLVLGYFGYRAVGTALASNSLIQKVQLAFLWGAYDPVIFMVMEDVAFFFLFYKKFYPKNIYMFAFLWGISDITFNVIYDAYHLPQLLSSPQYWQIGSSWTSYAEIMMIEGAIGVVGLILLRPKFDLSFSWVKYGGLCILVAGYAYSFATGYQVTSNPEYSSSVSLYILGFIENTGLLMLAYTIIRPRRAQTALT